MSVDNFDLLADWIRRNKTFDEDTVLFLQIIRRKKDNPEAKAQQTLKNFYLKSADDLLARKDEILYWCNVHNARAYLRLNVRSKRKIALQTLALVAENISNDNYNIKNCYESAAGQYHSDPDKTWIIDLDNDEYTDSMKYRIAECISDLIQETDRDPEILWLNTKNGVHLVCRPFNAAKFCLQMGFPATYHKDTPTLAYIP